jgi:hypothetical protein
MTLSLRRVVLSLSFCLVPLLNGCSDAGLPTEPGDELEIVLPTPRFTTLPVGGFTESFSATTLDPAWTVIPGVRLSQYSYPLPANHYSLTDRAGYLRYYVDAMTHYWGFFNGYQVSAPAEVSCCLHDPGLEIQRGFGGDSWVLEARADFYMPFTNGRQLAIQVVFGDGGPGSVGVHVHRSRDTNQNWLGTFPFRQSGTSIGSIHWLDYYRPVWLGLYDPPESTLYIRIQREGGLLKTWGSLDGTTWAAGASHDFGSELDGLEQRVILGGVSWFYPSGSYADWDYVNVVPTTLAVVIDIKPGSVVNPVDPNSNGVLPVAVLATEGFDAGDVDVGTVAFGPGEAAPAVAVGREDVDGDGIDDLILQFRVRETGLSCGDEEATLTGRTLAGRPFAGTDNVRVKCK